ncbi:MAG: carbohydrate-binding family 9-like protein [Planctomycetota bacterium]|jgi:hypothetical protein
MKSIDVQRVNCDDGSLEAIGAALDAQPKQALDTLNWESHPTKPEVSFALGYTDSELLVKYYVHEDAVLAEKGETNQSVCQDSCVEIFFSPREDLYFNCEFNCVATALVGRGSCREDSQRLPAETVDTIRRVSTLGSEPFGEKRGDFTWELTAAIPLALLEVPEGGLAGKSFRANLYKCSDNLDPAHYLTWNPVGTPEPDYHQPAYFGELKFV